MAFCSNCGHKLAESAKFCDSCGASVGVLVKQEGRKVAFDGEIHKCPQCGEVVDSFVGNCPSCGYELRGVNAVSSVQKLAEKLEEIESRRSEQKWRTFFQQKLNSQRISPIDKEKINVIQTFPIPNTKEDIREFLALAEANMQVTAYGSSQEREAQKAVADAWKNKYDQAAKKSKLLFKDSAEYQQLEIKKNKKGWKSWNPIAKLFWIVINIYLIGIPSLIYVVSRK